MSLMRLHLGSPFHVEDVFQKTESLQHAKYIAGTQNQLFGWNIRNEAAEGIFTCQVTAGGNRRHEMSPRKEVQVKLEPGETGGREASRHKIGRDRF